MALPAQPGQPAGAPLPPVGSGAPTAPPSAGGAGGVTQKSPNLGHMAGANAIAAKAIKMLEMALPMAGSSSDLGQAIMSAITKLGKLVPPNSGSPGVEQSAQHKLMMQDKQDAPMQQILRSQGGQPPQPQAA